MPRLRKDWNSEAQHVPRRGLACPRSAQRISSRRGRARAGLHRTGGCRSREECIRQRPGHRLRHHDSACQRMAARSPFRCSVTPLQDLRADLPVWGPRRIHRGNMPSWDAGRVALVYFVSFLRVSESEIRMVLRHGKFGRRGLSLQRREHAHVHLFYLRACVLRFVRRRRQR